MMFELDSFNLINQFERASNEPNAEQLVSSSAQLQTYVEGGCELKIIGAPAAGNCTRSEL